MSKICPINNSIVLYLDCLECDDKICRQPNKVPQNVTGNLRKDNKMKQKEYFDKIDKIMQSKGFICTMKSNPNTKNEVRHYIQPMKEDGSNFKFMVLVRAKREFKFHYSNLAMCAKLQTDWMGPISDNVHFTRMFVKFDKSVKALVETWGDY